MTKKTKFIFLLSVFVSLYLITGCNLPSDVNASNPAIKYTSYKVQSINTEENTEDIYNPDQGFYKSIVFSLCNNNFVFPKNSKGESDWKVLKDLATYTTGNHNDGEYFIKSYDYYLSNKDKDWDTVARKTEYVQLYHLRFDISELSEKINDSSDKEFPQQALSDLRFILETFKSLGFNVIVRFTYCPRFAWKDGSTEYPNSKDFEASPEYILKHVKSVCSVLKDYEDVVTAIEAGLVGPWGEMHTTKLGEENKEIIPDIVEEFLNGTKGTNIPVLVRTPDRIYAYVYKYLLNKNLSDVTSKRVKLADINDYQIQAGSKASRLGMFNDGYLGSKSDSNTFRSDDASRANQVEWLSKNISFRTPYGGEVINPTTDNDHYKLDNTVDFNTVEEMFALGLSYLNIGWNDKIVSYWHSTPYTGSDPAYAGKTEFTYIKNHMGYRLLVEESKLEYSDDNSFAISLKINNIGFGNLLKEKKASVLIVKDGNVIKELKNIASYKGEKSLIVSGSLPENFANYKDSDIYIRLDNGSGVYPLQFANKDMWNNDLKANRVGKI